MPALPLLQRAVTRTVSSLDSVGRAHRCLQCRLRAGQARGRAWSCELTRVGELCAVCDCRCMQCGDSKDRQPTFCSRECEEQQHQMQQQNDPTASGHSWLARFTFSSPSSIAPRQQQHPSPSYSHSFQRACWFGEENRPCVSCPQCGSALTINPKIMTAIQEKMAQERRAKRAQSDEAAMSERKVDQPLAAAMEEEEKVQPLASLSELALGAEQQRGQHPQLDEGEMDAEVDAVSAADLQLDECASQLQSLPLQHQLSSSASLQAGSCSSRAPTPMPLSSGSVSNDATAGAAAPACAESAAASCSFLPPLDLLPPLPSASSSSALPSPSSHAARTRLQHPLHVQTKELELLPLSLESPLTPTTVTQAINEQLVQQQQQQLQAAGELEERARTPAEWNGELQCEECSHTFRFVDLQ